jgi:hypothetical protein
MLIRQYTKMCDVSEEGIAAVVVDTLGRIAIEFKFVLVGETDHWLVVDIDRLDISAMASGEYFRV